MMLTSFNRYGNYSAAQFSPQTASRRRTSIRSVVSKPQNIQYSHANLTHFVRRSVLAVRGDEVVHTDDVRTHKRLCEGRLRRG